MLGLRGVPRRPCSINCTASEVSPPPPSNTSPTTQRLRPRPSSSSIKLSTATQEDYWQAADVHCTAFYNSNNSEKYNSSFLMVDRVIALEIGRECQDVFARGRFSCILAKIEEEEEEKEEDTSPLNNNITTTTTTPTISPLAASLLSLILPPKLKYNLARQHGDTVGAVVIDTLNQHLPPNKHTNKPRKDIAYLSNLAVHPSNRRSGLGRMLLVAAEKLARDVWGCRCIALHVDPDNSAAVELYKKNGYKVVMDQPEWQRILEMRRRPLKLMMKRINGRERREECINE